MNTTSTGLGRTNSGRDKNKPRLSLGPDNLDASPSPRIPKAFYLVVCGATSSRLDGFLFGDFFGWCMALKEKNVGGDFYSCFPLEEHFDWLDKKKPPVEDIKFGKIGPNRSEHMFVYTRKQFERRESWWTQKEPTRLKMEVLTWIRERKNLAESGDVVNILFACHGSATGGAMRIGDSLLWPGELKSHLRSTKDEVQVNMITTACYSGHLVNAIKADNQDFRYVQSAAASDEMGWSLDRSVSNRLRSSRFTQAFCLSLAKFTLPGFQGQYQVIEHENAVKQETIRNITPAANVSNPQSYHGAPVHLGTSMASLIFRNCIDVVYDPAATARRKRIEWPTSNTALLNLVQNHAGRQIKPSTPVINRAASVLDYEFSFCNTNQNYRGDEGLISYRFFEGDDVYLGPLLDILYWRARQQSAIWDVFCQLVARGYIQFSNLALPMAMSKTSEQAQSLSWLLQCFDGPAKESRLPVESRCPFQDSDFDLPFIWLATMVLRGSGDMDGLLSTIERCEYLGALDMEAYEEWRQHCNHAPKADTEADHMQCNPQEGFGKLKEPSQFGFWLPHGIGSADRGENFFDAIEKRHISRFDAIEEAYVEYFGLSQEDILTANQQESYYSQHPDKLLV